MQLEINILHAGNTICFIRYAFIFFVNIFLNLQKKVCYVLEIVSCYLDRAKQIAKNISP